MWDFVSENQNRIFTSKFLDFKISRNQTYLHIFSSIGSFRKETALMACFLDENEKYNLNLKISSILNMGFKPFKVRS